MADIFDLARSINAQKQQASQGYGSALEDLPLQIGQIFAQRDKEKRVELKQDATILNNLIQGATTEEQIANMEKAVGQYSKDTYGKPSLKLYNQVVQSNAKTKRDAFTQGKNALDWIDQKMNEEVPDYEGVYEAVTGFKTGDRAQRHNNPGAHIWTPELETKYGATKGDSFTDSEGKEYYTAHYDDMEKGTEASKFVVKKIWDNSGGDTSKFVKDYSGSSDADTLRGYEDAVNGKVGKGSYFNYSVDTMMNWGIDDIESRVRELDKFERGMAGFTANKFQYGKGSYSDTTLMKEYGDYKNKLESTMKAHLTAGIISEEEALSIMRGTYKTDKIEIIKTIDKNIKGYDSAISGLSGRKWDMMEDNAKNALLISFGAEDAIGLSGAEFQEKITKTIQDIQDARSKEYKRKHLWTGREKDAMGADFMKHQKAGDGVTEKGELLKEIEKGKPAEEKQDIPIGIARLKDISELTDDEGKSLLPEFKKTGVTKIDKVDRDGSFMEELGDITLEALDTDLGKAGIVIGGTALALETPAIAQNTWNATKFMAKNTAKAAKFIGSITNLTPTQITEFLTNDGNKSSLRALDKYQEQLKGLSKNSTKYKELTGRIKSIMDNRSLYWAKKFGVDKGVIDNLWSGTARNKWNILKPAQKLGGKLLTKALSGYAVGDVVNRALDTDLGALEQLGVGVGAQTVAKRNLSKFAKYVTTRKGQRKLMKFFGKTVAKRIVGGAAIGSAAPGLGTLAGGIVGAGLTIYDIAQFLKEDKED